MGAEGGTGVGMGAAGGEWEHMAARANAVARRGITKHNVTTRTRRATCVERQGT